MIGRQLIDAPARKPPPIARVTLTPPLARFAVAAGARPAPRRARSPRACPCDVDLAVFGHTQCALAGVPWPDNPHAHPPL